MHEEHLGGLDITITPNLYTKASITIVCVTSVKLRCKRPREAFYPRAYSQS